MSERAQAAACLLHMAHTVFGLVDDARATALAEEAAEMFEKMASASFENTDEPFVPPAKE